MNVGLCTLGDNGGNGARSGDVVMLVRALASGLSGVVYLSPLLSVR